jgi:two-component system, NtrC family, response regulator HupR/HoxA
VKLFTGVNFFTGSFAGNLFWKVLAPAPIARPARRYVRFLCSLNASGREMRAVCSNIGPSGLYVRLSPDAARDASLTSGVELQVSFRLPTDRRLLSSPATIVWIDPDDRDAAGRPSTGLGLRLDGAEQETLKSIASFIETFRYAVLIVDSNAPATDALKKLLDTDYRVLTASSTIEAMETLESTEVAVVIIDERMHAISSTALMRRFFERPAGSHALQITLSVMPESRRIAEQTPQLGRSYHILKKPFSDEDLRLIVRRAADAYSLGVENERLSEELERANLRLMRENRYLRSRLDGLRGFESIVGNSPALTRSLSELERIRQSEATVHIRGETGTGKELVARALHLGGTRANQAFIVQNRANLADSFRAAGGGTLFLDEVADLTPAAQTSLLSLLQERDTNARVISATHKDLRAEVEAGRFREDLYFRLVVIALTLPPLRDREGDVPLLAQHFLDLMCEKYGKNIPGLTHDAMLALEAYHWPGNVRELENEIERAVVLSVAEQRVPIEHLSPHISRGTSRAAKDRPQQGVLIPEHLGYDEALRVAQIELIERALARSGGLVSRAADALGIERSRLVKLRQRLGLA